MKKTIVMICSAVLIVTLYFNTGYLIASSFNSMNTRQCDVSSYTYFEKFLSTNGFWCINGNAIKTQNGAILPMSNFQFVFVAAMWPVLFALSLVSWIIKLFWHYIFCGGIFKAIGVV